MRTVTLGVSSIQDHKTSCRRISREPLGEFLSCHGRTALESATTKRWAILQAMAGQGEMTIREIGRRVDRDVKAVHPMCSIAAGRCAGPRCSGRRDLSLRRSSRRFHAACSA